MPAGQNNIRRPQRSPWCVLDSSAVIYASSAETSCFLRFGCILSQGRVLVKRGLFPVGRLEGDARQKGRKPDAGDALARGVVARFEVEGDDRAVLEQEGLRLTVGVEQLNTAEGGGRIEQRVEIGVGIARPVLPRAGPEEGEQRVGGGLGGREGHDGRVEIALPHPFEGLLLRQDVQPGEESEGALEPLLDVSGQRPLVVALADEQLPQRQGGEPEVPAT